jgi:cytochrome c peroxidase
MSPVAQALRVAAAALLTLAAAPSHSAERGAWTVDEASTIDTLRLGRLPPAPLDPSNAVDGKVPAAALGKRLFNDVRFSSNGKVSCASCHAPDKQFQDGLPVGRGIGTGSRRAMPIVGAGHSPWLFWDGRKDSLWAQALGPLEDAVEHGGNRTRYAKLVQANYKAEYQALFGPFPDLTALPDDAGPLGSPAEGAAWAALPPASRDAISRVFANMGKALAAYEKSLRFGEARFDRYANALVARDGTGQQVLTRQEVEGLRLFIGKGQCVSCHNGPLLTDQAFHNTAVPQRDPAKPDRGRAAALAKVMQDEFNCLGRFSDAKPEACGELTFMTKDPKGLEGAFKTPGLRNVAMRPPYMHAGQFATLEDVIAHYIKAPPATVGHTELAHGEPGHTHRKPIRLSEQEIKDLAAFLGTLSGPIVEGVQR